MIGYLRRRNQMLKSSGNDVPNNKIYYWADTKANETTSTSTTGILTSAFDATIIEHKFEGGKGSIVFDKEVTSIGYKAFCNCNLNGINIPNNVVSIGQDSFRGNKLLNFKIPNKIKTIGAFAFYGCTFFDDIVIPNTLLNYGTSIFFQFKGENINIYWNTASTVDFSMTTTATFNLFVAEGCKSIGSFYASGFRLIDLPTTTETIEGTFTYSMPATSIICRAITPPTITRSGGLSLMGNGASRTIVYVPDESVDAYKASEYWSGIAGRIRGISQYTG